jgi:hypothetical protein
MPVFNYRGMCIPMCQRSFDIASKYLDKAASQGSADWLKERSDPDNPIITASRVGTLLGNTRKYGETPENLMDQLTGLQPMHNLEGKPAVEMGKDMEPYIRDFYAQTTGSVVIELPMIPHPEYPWLRGSVDGLTADGKLVEFKFLAMRKFSILSPPAYYYDQIQFLMHLLDLKECDFVEFKSKCVSVTGNDDMNILKVERSQQWWDQSFPVLLKCYETMKEKIALRKEADWPLPPKMKPEWSKIDFICNARRKKLDLNQYKSYRHEASL